MTITRTISTKRQFALSALLLGLLWAQLIPLIPAQIGGQVIQLCTLQGLQYQKVSDAESPFAPSEKPQDIQSKSQCPFCIVRTAIFIGAFLPEVSLFHKDWRFYQYLYSVHEPPIGTFYLVKYARGPPSLILIQI